MASRLPDSSPEGRFEPTDWGLIAAAKGGASPPDRQALAGLCETYWYPLYAYIRRRGYSVDQAQDLTQGFFTSLLGRDFLKSVAPEKGKFRSYLLAACQNFLANHHDRERAEIHGGQCQILSIDMLEAESRFALEPAHEMTAERLFERCWAVTLLEQALERFGAEVTEEGKGALFEHLRPALLGDGSAVPHAEVAREMAMTTAAVKMAALRFRERFRKLLRDEVSRTVADPKEVDDEIRNLFSALAD